MSSKLGIRKMDLLTNSKQLKSLDLSSYKAVYFDAANTYELLHFLKSTKADEKIKLFFARGGIIYAKCAGAVVMSKNINTIEGIDHNNINLRDFSGLNLVNNNSIWIQHNKHDNSRIVNFIRKNKDPLIVLSKTVGVFIKGSKIKILGRGKAYKLILLKNNSIRKILPSLLIIFYSINVLDLDMLTQ